MKNSITQEQYYIELEDLEVNYNRKRAELLAELNRIEQQQENALEFLQTRGMESNLDEI